MLDNAMNPEGKRKAEYFIKIYEEIEEKWTNIDNMEQK
jgi:hypothetical protein